MRGAGRFVVSRMSALPLAIGAGKGSKSFIVAHPGDLFIGFRGGWLSMGKVQ